MRERGHTSVVRTALAVALAPVLVSCAAGSALDWSWRYDRDMPPVVASDAFSWSSAPRASVLFVIDNRASTCGLQSALWRGVPAFIDALRTLAPEVELRIGVIASEATDPRLAGALSTGPTPDRDDGCDAFVHPDCAALLAEGGGRLAPIVTETTEATALALACLMDVGTGAPGDPFMAAAAALAPDRLAATGLVGDGSLLAVVIISDEMSDQICADPIPGASVFECELATAAPDDGPGRLARLAATVPGVADFYLARLPLEGEDGTLGVPSGLGPILSPTEGGLSPVCSIPTNGDATAGTLGTSPSCVDSLGPALYAVARDMASALVPGCLEAPPCPGVGARDILVEVGGEKSGVPLDPNEDYYLVPDPSCTGGFRIDFTTEPMAGDEVTIDYPAGSAVSCGG